MRVLLLVAIGACASAPRVVVRMAKDGEVVPAAPPRSPPPRGQRVVYFRCQVRGEPVAKYLDPVLELARNQLVEKLVSGFPPMKARVYLVGPGILDPTPRNGIEIVIDPRSVVGRLRTKIKVWDWEASIEYCLHVLRDGNVTTIVVKLQSEWIM